MNAPPDTPFDPPLPALSDVTLPGARMFDLAPRAGGPPWRIFLAVPDAPPPPAGFPAIYLLDANAGFATFAETLRRGSVRSRATGIVPAVLVGIGYPATDSYDRERRTFDFTAGPGVEGGARATGGRDAFLAFIEHELKPLVARLCPVDPARQTLFGHSLGGFFALDVLARDARAFRNYVAVSPSIWWDEPRLVAGLGAARPAAGTRLAVLVGEWEQALAPWQQGLPESADFAARRARRAMADRARAIASQAAGVLGEARVAFHLLAQEDHASVLPVAISRALRFVLAED